MNTIKRDVYVLKNTIKIPIEVTKGTDAITFEFTVRDYNLPATAAAVAYAYRMGMKRPNSTLCDVSGNVISFQPSANFFEVGNNELQIRVINEDKSLISFKEKVKCSDSMGFPDEEEEKQKSLVEQLVAYTGKETAERKEADDTEKSERIAADVTEKAERKKEIAVERARIDQMTKLPDGSTTGDAELQDIRVGADGKTYETAGAAVREQVSSLNEDLGDFTNIYNQYITSELYQVPNSYWSSATEQNAISDARSYTQIPLDKGLYFYKGIYAYFSWIVYPDGTYERFSNIVNNQRSGYFYLSKKAEIKLTVQNSVDKPILTNDLNLFLGNTTYYQGKKKCVNTDQFSKVKQINISVKQDGSEGFDTLKSATEFIDKIYDLFDKFVIDIYGGTYNIYSEYGGNNFYNSIVNTSNNRLGVQLKDNVSLIGQGDVILTFEAEDAVSNPINTECVSVLEVYGNTTIENIQIIAKNCRYCIHDETGGLLYRFASHKYKNVHLYHKPNKEGTWTSTAPIAIGSSSGNKYVFENCTFKSDDFVSWSYHNNAGQEGNTITLDGCVFDGNWDNLYALRFGYYGDNTRDTNIFIKSCNSNKKGIVRPESDSGVNDNVFKVHNFTNIEIETL